MSTSSISSFDSGMLASTVQAGFRFINMVFKKQQETDAHMAHAVGDPPYFPL